MYISLLVCRRPRISKCDKKLYRRLRYYIAEIQKNEIRYEMDELVRISE